MAKSFKKSKSNKKFLKGDRNLLYVSIPTEEIEIKGITILEEREYEHTASHIASKEARVQS